LADIEFQAWPKTPRLFRSITVTEKIDGTNACVVFTPDGDGGYVYAAQSRNRLITPEADNAGFAAWVYENHAALFEKLGYGRHYGEWWGQKIGRKYDMAHRVFSLFNTDMWSVKVGDGFSYPIGGAVLTHVPVLYRGEFAECRIIAALKDLRENGSFAAPGFMNPEGLCVYHSQTRSVFKVTLDNQDRGKWEVANA
jgi:hypothetical protein